MANLNIAIKIGAQDAASGPIGAVTNALRQLTSSTGVVGRGFSGLQAVVQGALLGGMALLVAGFLGVGMAAFDMANEVSAATAKLSGQLGLDAEQAEAYGETVKNIYGQNFGESVAAVGEAVGAVSLQFSRLGGVTQETIEAATINAYRLADAYDIEVSEAAAAAAGLMNDFGLSQEEAFDLITTGFQNGMNASDDYLDSLGEYGVQFAGLGFEADQFFSVLLTGQEAGVLGTDKMADAVKEWGIIMNEGGDRASQALAALDMDYNAMAASVSAGDAVWADYFGEIVSGLQEVEDPIKRQQLAVQLFGTMAEDMGAGFLEGMDMMAVGLEEMAGATAGLDAQYNDLNTTIEGFRRRALVAIEPLGQAMLVLANFVMPYVAQAFDLVEPAIAGFSAAVNGFIANMQEGMAPLDAFIEAIWDIAPQGAIDALLMLRDQILPALGAAFTTYVAPLADAVAQNVQLSDVLAVVGLVVASVVLPALAGIIAAAAPVILVFAGLVAAVALMRNAWEGNWGGIQEKTATAVAFVSGVVQTGVAQVRAWWDENGAAVMAKAAEVWAMVSTAVATGIEAVQTFVADGVAQVQAWWDENGELVMAKAAEVWETVQTVVNDGIEAAKGFVSAGTAQMQAWWATHGDQVMSIVQLAFTAVKNIITIAVGLIATVVMGTINTLQAAWAEWGDELTTLAQGAWDTIIVVIEGALDVIEGIFTAFNAAVAGDWDAFWEGLRQTADGMFAAVSAVISSGWETIKGLFSAGVQAARDTFTSVDWGGVGASIIDAIAGSISNGVGKLASAAMSAAMGAVNAAISAAANAWGAASAAFGGGGGGGGGGSSSNNTASDALPGGNRTLGLPGFTAVGQSPALVGTGGGSGDTYIVHVDARGASATADEIKRAVQMALREMGIAADQRIRSRTS